MSNCLMIRHRVAPMARRMATSRARLAERESSRLATLAQAMSSTNATAPIIERNTARIGPPLNRWLNVSRIIPPSSS